MTGFDVQTISDKEAAEKVGFPLRHVRRVLDECGLCLKVNRNRRLTEAQFHALIAALTAEPRMVYQPSLRTPAVRARATTARDELDRALALVRAGGKKSKRRGARSSTTVTPPKRDP